MNYQEMVNAQQNLTARRETLPFGKFYRKQLDNKYRQVIDLKKSLADSVVFCEALRKDQQWTAGHGSRQQIKFVLSADEAGVHGIDLEQGHFLTLAQLLFDEPATIAASGFVDRVINDLFDVTEKLHADGIYQLCYSPQTVFVRKGDTTPLLLFHGSFYTDVNDVQSLYEGVADYVAPEVMSREAYDERSDIYSLGKFIAYLFAQGSIPFEYKQVVKKATAADPSKRFKTIGQMRSAITARRGALRSAIGFAAAVVIALLGVWLYLDMVPQTEYIEFVEPAPKEVVDDANEITQYEREMLMMADDSIVMTEEDRKYMAKAEEIFRKRFETTAEKAFSKVYDDQNLSSSEKKFKAGSQTVEELMQQQAELATEMGIDIDHANAIAEEVIGRLSAEKQKGLTNNGYIKAE